MALLFLFRKQLLKESEIDIMAKNRKFTQEKVETIIKLFNDGESYVNISNEVGINPDSISRYLRENGYKRIQYKEMVDVDIVAPLYLNNEWDEIYRIYPFLNKQRVYSIMSDNHISKDSYFWQDEDVKILVDNHDKCSYTEISKMMDGRHSRGAVSFKAAKLGFARPQEWTQEELDIFINNYSYVTKDEIMQLLPNRTWDAMVCMGRKLGVKSFYYLQAKYTDKEKQFIRDNFGVLTDKEIAEKLGKTEHGIRDQRLEMRLIYACKDYSKYENLSKFLRGHIQEWKNKTMELCNYQCVFTGSKDFAIHHLHGFNSILSEVYDILGKENKLISLNLSDYSKDQLDYMLEVFKVVHAKYPYGVCVRNDIHDLFHRIYGSGGNTEAQWNNFVIRYNNHEFDDCYYV